MKIEKKKIDKSLKENNVSKRTEKKRKEGKMSK